MKEFGRIPMQCEAYLRWHPVKGDKETETLVARATTFIEAKERVIAMFLRIPPGETVNL